MKRAHTVSLIALLSAVPALAGQEGPYALDFHFTGTSYAGCAALPDASLSCATMNPNGVVVSNFMWAWVVISGVPDPAGVGSVSFGIDHALTDIVWSTCTGGTDMPQAGWPATGTGITITWPDDCYVVTDNGDGATALGSFVVANDETTLMFLRDDPRVGEALVTDCDALTTEICLERLGIADATVNGTQGMVVCGNPCVTPAEEATWGAIKAVYGR